MKTIIIILATLGLVALILGINIGIAFLIYKGLLWAGAPNWVAVLCGIAYFCITGWVASIKRS